jgi:hypothetical protein
MAARCAPRWGDPEDRLGPRLERLSKTMTVMEYIATECRLHGMASIKQAIGRLDKDIANNKVPYTPEPPRRSSLWLPFRLHVEQAEQTSPSTLHGRYIMRFTCQ